MKQSRIEVSKHYALQVLSTDAYLRVNKNLIKLYGHEEAFFISNLVDKYIYFDKKNKLEEGGFFLTHEQQMEETALSEYKIRLCKKLFKEEGLIQTKMKGLPAKEWYFLHWGMLVQKLSDFAENDVSNNNSHTESSKPSEDKPYGNRKGNPLRNHKESIRRTNYNKNKDIDTNVSYVLAEHFDKKTHQAINNIISYWGTLPNTIAHKIDSKNPSKKYQKLHQWIGNLLQGRPFLENKDGTLPKNLQAFCRSNAIDPKLLQAGYTSDQIKKILKHALRQFNQYSDKKADLEAIIWSPFAYNKKGWSHFLEVVAEINIPKRYKKLAHAFSKIVSSSTLAKKKTWARTFQRFIETEFNGSAEDVYNLIKWYQKNHARKYVPSAFTAEIFCEKYDSIKARKLEWDDSKNPSTGYRRKDGKKYMTGNEKEV